MPETDTPWWGDSRRERLYLHLMRNNIGADWLLGLLDQLRRSPLEKYALLG